MKRLIRLGTITFFACVLAVTATPGLALMTNQISFQGELTDASGSDLDADLLDGRSEEDFLGIGGGSLSGPLSVTYLAIDDYTVLTTGGDDNHSLFLGLNTDHIINVGRDNTFVGSGAGQLNASGNGNVFLGARAGANETGSNKLYVSSTGTSSPLIYGEFDNQLLRFNGTLSVDRHTGPHLIINDTTNDPAMPGIQFANNYIHYISGDDQSDEYFGFYAGYGADRTYDAKLRIHGKSTGDWGRFIGLSHDGTYGIIETDTGELVLDPADDVTIADGSDLNIEGTANGIEFSDDTRQTTAGLTQFDYQRTENTINYWLPEGATASVTVSCPSGYVVSGGGASINGNLGMQIITSKPLSDTQWFAQFWNSTSVDKPNTNLTAYAVSIRCE